MSTEQKPVALALLLKDRCLRVANDLFDSDDSDSAEAVRDSAVTLGAQHWELAELRTQIADLTLSLEASERRVENHNSLIKGYQAELAAAKAQVEALSKPPEPVMIYHGRCTIDCGEHGHNDVEMLKMIPAGTKLYAAPQPSLTRPATLYEHEDGSQAVSFIAPAPFSLNEPKWHRVGPVEVYGAPASELTRPAVPNGWAAGVEAVARMLDKKADAYAATYGHDDMGGLSFGAGSHAEARLEYHSTLIELAEEARAMLAAAPQPEPPTAS